MTYADRTDDVRTMDVHLQGQNDDWLPKHQSQPVHRDPFPKDLDVPYVIVGAIWTDGTVRDEIVDG